MIKFHFVLFIFLLTKLLHCYFNVFNLGQSLPDSKWTFESNYICKHVWSTYS